jgi:hypothetical protein
LWKLDSATTQKILFEIEQIDELITDSRPVIDLCKIREPDFVEKCGIALILHSFYNGIENILSLIIKNKDLVLPNGIKWHKELFVKAFEKTENRSQIFMEEARVGLNDYLQFRHFVRHSYGFQLKWEKMKNMFFDMDMIWKNIKMDINIFIENN